MKTFLWCLPAVILLAAGCNTTLSRPQSPTELPRTNWRLYTSNEWDFSIEYPPDWTIESSSYYINIGEPVRDDNGFLDNIGISYYDTLEQAPRYGRDSRQRNYGTLAEYMSDQEYRDVSIVDFASQKAYRGLMYNPVLNYTGSDLVVEHNGHVYIIGAPNPPTEIDTVILASFRFLNRAQ